LAGQHALNDLPACSRHALLFFNYNYLNFVMWFVYVLSSLKNKFIYIGSTNDLNRRLKQHNDGEVKSTKAYIPYKIITYIAVETEQQARKLEQYFKTGSGKAVLYNRIIGSNPLATEASA
jgi:putative endonuclease